MNNTEILDREKICKYISELIDNTKETFVYFLISKSGIGKSSVSKKTFQMSSLKSPKKHFIQTFSIQNNDNIQEGVFLKNIFISTKRYFDNVEQTTKNPFKKHKYKKSTFIYWHNKNKKLRNFMIAAEDKISSGIEISASKDKKWKVLKNISLSIKPLEILLKYFCLKLEVQAELNEEDINAKLMKKYLSYIFERGNCVYCIDNIQNLDEWSLLQLMDILVMTKASSNFFLLEFTSFEGNYMLFEKIKQKLDYADIPFDKYILPVLEKEFVEKIINQMLDKQNEVLCKDILSQYETKFCGNIKKIENSVTNYNNNIFDLRTDPTLKKIKNYTQDEQYILAIVILNGGQISKDFLKYILTQSSNFYYPDNFDISRLDVLKEEKDKINIIHADTITTWHRYTDNYFKEVELLAYKNCQNAIQKLYRNNDVIRSITKKEILLLSLKLYNKFQPIKINMLLDELDKIIYDMLSLEELENYLDSLIMEFHTYSSLNLLYNICSICNRFQLMKTLKKCLDIIEGFTDTTKDEKYLFYKLSYLLQREFYKDILNLFVNQDVNSFSLGFRYYIDLFEIVSLVSLNQDSSQIIQKLENDNMFCTTKQYGYFLRLSEAYDKRNIAIPKVKKSIEIFNDFGMDVQAAKSRISLVFLYSITGELEKAEIQLKKAASILLKKIENKYIFNINKACLYLLKGNYSVEVKELLTDAEKYAYMNFDKIAIIINKIVYSIENEDKDLGTYSIKQGLDLLQTESNHHLFAIFFYDCYLFYKKFGQREKSEEYYKYSVKYKDHCETLKARLEGRSEVADNTTFLLNYPWHICFVSYWYFDLIYDDSMSR